MRPRSIRDATTEHLVTLTTPPEDQPVIVERTSRTYRLNLVARIAGEAGKGCHDR